MDTAKLCKHCAKTLKKYRKARQISQLSLEVDARLNFGTISRIENEKVNPSKETLLKIAFVLKLQPFEVLDLFGMGDDYWRFL